MDDTAFRDIRYQGVGGSVRPTAEKIDKSIREAIDGLIRPFGCTKCASIPARAAGERNRSKEAMPRCDKNPFEWAVQRGFSVSGSK